VRRRRFERLISDQPEDNNQKVKRFPGGGLYIVWASSPAELSSRPAELLLFDEKAAFQPTKEGDPVKLGQARQKTYDGTELTVYNSTPRRCDCAKPGDDCGDITHDYERGDQREFYVPCPNCDEFQTLKFGGQGHGIRAEMGPGDARDALLSVRALPRADRGI
jgi:phage terminase large subunit GpA-like protein